MISNNVFSIDFVHIVIKGLDDYKLSLLIMFVDNMKLEGFISVWEQNSKRPYCPVKIINQTEEIQM